MISICFDFSGSNCHQLDHHIPCSNMPMSLQQPSPSLCSTSSSLAAPTNMMGQIRPNILYTPRSDFDPHLGNNLPPQQHLLQPSYHDQSLLCYPDITCGTNSTLQNPSNGKMLQKQPNKDNTLPKASDTMTENMLFG